MIESLNWTLLIMIGSLLSHIFETLQGLPLPPIGPLKGHSVTDLPDGWKLLFVIVLSTGAGAVELTVQSMTINTEILTVHTIAVVLVTQFAHPLTHKVFPVLIDAIEAKFNPPTLPEPAVKKELGAG